MHKTMSAVQRGVDAGVSRLWVDHDLSATEGAAVESAAIDLWPLVINAGGEAPASE